MRQGRGPSTRDIRQLEEHELQAMYEEGYCLPLRCNLLQGLLDLVQFDAVVNTG